MESKANLGMSGWFVMLFMGIFVLLPAYGFEQNFERFPSDDSFLLDVDSAINSPEPTQNNIKKATKLTLGAIPSEIRENESITFSGRLQTEDKKPVSGVLVYIKDDDTFGPDDTITFALTNSNGRFIVDIPAKDWDSSSGGASEVYAEFNGDSNYLKSETPRQKIKVYHTFEKQFTKLVLDPLRVSSALVGDKVLFTGTLTSFDKPVSGATIYIRQDDFITADGYFAEGKTDSNGKFSIQWEIHHTLPLEKTLDMYAKFEGNSEYFPDRSKNQLLDVLKTKTWITLDKILSSTRIGEYVLFTGTLQFEKGNTEGAIVYIKDEDFLGRDDHLSTAWVDSDGSFSAAWLAKKNDPNKEIEVYAEFKGDRFLSGSTTCGGGCMDTQKMTIDSTPISYPTIDSQEYIELDYSKKFEKSPLVTIVTSPDSYDELKGAIIPAKEGILLWSDSLREKFGGMWDVEFDVASKDSAFFTKKPDIVLNLVTEDEDRNCLHSSGYKRIYLNHNPVNIVVCIEPDDLSGNYSWKRGTAAHEYAHALGLGHAFNISGDLMCSTENGIPTCPNYGNRAPSDFDLAAIVALYKYDGFLVPNNNISGDVKFTTIEYEKIIETANVIEQVQPIIDNDNDFVVVKEVEGIALFVDPNQDPQYYVNRYNQEPAYKKWFDDNFSEYDSIYQAVGLSEPKITELKIDYPELTLKPIPDKTIIEGKTLSFSVSVTDGLADNLTFSLKNPPGGASINSRTGQFSWTPSIIQGNVDGFVYNFDILVQKGSQKDSESITITVKENSKQPTKPAIKSEPAPIKPEPEPVLSDSGSKPQTVHPCGEGTHAENGKCIPNVNSDWQIFENIQNWFNENIVKPIASVF